MDPSSDLTKAGLLGLLFGVGGYILACALHVWWRRNRVAAGKGMTFGGMLASGFSGLLFVGLVLVAVSAAWREFVPRQGHLTSDDLLAVRVPDDRAVSAVVQGEHVAAGEELARFDCPKTEAKIRVLLLRQQSLAAERAILASRPLKLDPDLVRRYQEMAADRRQLRASLDQLSPARDLVVREKLRQLLNKRQELQDLEAQVARAEKELEQAEAKSSYLESALERTRRASRNGVATIEEVEQQESEKRIADAEVKRVLVKLASLKATRKELHRGLQEYEAVAVAQSKSLTTEIGTAQKQMATTSERTRYLVDQIEHDAARARKLRAKEIERLEVEIAQAKAECEGLQKSLVATAPFSGKIVYRDPSPRAASGKAPLVVLAGEDALRVRVRLSAVEARALAEEPEVTLSLDEPGVQRRFLATFLASEPLPADPDCVAVELACSPPKRIIRDVVEEDQIKASLVWRPPLTIYPMFWAGLALAGLGFVGRVGLGAVTRKARAQAQPRPAEQEAPGASAGAPMPRPDLSYATGFSEVLPEESAVHGEWVASESTRFPSQLMVTLGEQLRAMLAEDRRDESLVRGLEWVMRHAGSCDIALIRQGLDGDPLVHERIREIEQCAARDIEAPDRRLARALRVVAPDVLLEEPTFGDEAGYAGQYQGVASP